MAATRRALALLSAVALAVGPAAPAAQAAPLRRSAVIGQLTVTPSSGTVDGNPMLVSATTSAPCPARYGAAALLRVGPAGGPYSNIVRPGQAGDYDRAPFTLAANRSMTTSQGAAPRDGEYEIVVECVSADLGPHPDRFVAPIVVDGGSWALKQAGKPAAQGNPPAPPAEPPAPGGQVSSAVPPPPATAGAAASATASGPAASTTAPDGGSAGTGTPTAGTRLAAGPARDVPVLPWILGAVAVVLVAAAVAIPLIRRGRRAQS
ncbi:hypothetical protein ACI2K4_14675 [Micromonospora sp. NPDC050397]|uniref:hypothetical protein n=1 Tax=Micromonospora sp. NPDC050397 TaxID=3364279 RepID=UPI00384AB637